MLWAVKHDVSCMGQQGARFPNKRWQLPVVSLPNLRGGMNNLNLEC